MVDKSRSRSKNGAGLGLALCVEILRLHNSTLEIESRVGEGTKINFVIPAGNPVQEDTDKRLLPDKKGDLDKRDAPDKKGSSDKKSSQDQKTEQDKRPGKKEEALKNEEN